jgi:hypothetical protein
MNSHEFKEIIVFEDFEIENGVLGLEWDVYLSVIKFLDSLILRKVWVNVFCFFLIFICVFCSILALVKNHTHEWNTFTWWFIDWKKKFFFFFFFFINSFFLLFIYWEIEFIKLLDGVKMQWKTIKFTKDEEYCTVFINKMINSGIVKMFNFLFVIFIFIYSILLAKCYAFAQIIVVGLVWETYFFLL